MLLLRKFSEEFFCRFLRYQGLPLLALTLLFFHNAEATGLDFKNLTSTTAVSGNILVFSGEARERNLCLHHVEALRKQFLSATGVHSCEKVPIILLLHADLCLSEASVLRLERNDDESLKIQVDVGQQDLDSFDFDEVLVTAFLLQMIYEKNDSLSKEDAPVILLPPWLTLGLTHFVRTELPPESSSSWCCMLSKKQPSLPAFLREEPPRNDLSLLELYGAQAELLVEVGLDSDQRRAAFQAALQALLPSQNTCDFWPEGWNQKQIESQWLLLMKERASFRAKQRGVSPTASLKRLQNLMFRKISWKGKQVDRVTTSQGILTLQELKVQLQALRQQSNPLVKPVVEQYLELLAQLPRTSSKKIKERLSLLQTSTAALNQRIQGITHFLDNYERKEKF